MYCNFLKHPYPNPKGLPDDHPLSIKIDGQTRDLHRPNHGLAHVLRQAYYVPFVADFLLANPPPGYSKGDFEFTACQLYGMMMVCLFMPVGRENEAGSQSEDSDIDRFWVVSAQHLMSFLSKHSWLDLVTYGISADMYTQSIFHDPPTNRPASMVLTPHPGNTNTNHQM